MSDEAIKFRSLHKEMNFKKMSLSELQKLPPYNGIYNFKISDTSFSILNILNDDGSAVKHFWKGSHDQESLDLWFNISKEGGVLIDVGAHTGLYTLTALKSNKENEVICFEPYFMNLSRLITNLRINGFYENANTVLGAISNFDGKSKLKINTERYYMGQGGKIDDDGIDIDVYKLDTLYHNKLNKRLKAIKIDTEGEDFNVLMGSEKLIKEHNPEIIIEASKDNFENIVNFLKNKNYKVYDILDLNNEINLERFKIKGVMNLYAKH